MTRRSRVVREKSMVIPSNGEDERRWLRQRRTTVSSATRHPFRLPTLRRPVPESPTRERVVPQEVTSANWGECMERSVEVLAVILFGVIGLSHVLQLEAWVDFFILLRGKGKPALPSTAF